MSNDALTKNSLMHSLQCVHAMARMMEEYIASPAPTNKERGSLGQLLIDFDSVVDNLTTVYEEAINGDGRYPSSQELEAAFADYTLVHKT